MTRGSNCHLEPSDLQWTKLFDLSKSFRSVAPWKYRTRQPLFGIELPGSGETVYICTAGFDAHRPGLIAYYGDQGFHCCCDTGEDGWVDPLQMVYRARHLKVVYMDRDQLRKEERKLIKSQGLKFRNRFNWPAFRSFLPGYVTWRLNKDEAADLIVLMEQTCQLLSERPDLIHQDKIDGTILIRRFESGDPGRWIDEEQPIPVRPGCCGGVKLRPGVIRGLRDLPLSDNVMSVEVFVANDMLYDEHNRPYYPMCLVMTDENSGLSIHSSLIGGCPDLTMIAQSIGDSLADGLRRNAARPGTVLVRSRLLGQILEPMISALAMRQTSHLDFNSVGKMKWEMVTAASIMEKMHIN